MPTQNTLTTSELTIVGAGAQQTRVYSGTAAPVAGAFMRGDMVINAAPTPGSPFGWHCTASGWPGTWVQINA